MTQNDSPIFLLPPELTSTIFQHCLLEETLDGNYLSNEPSPGHAPLLLTQICSQWREICIATPELWASFTFRRGTPELLQTWLSRAGSYPLSFALDSTSETDTRADALMATVMPYCRQWRYVRLSLPPPAYLQLSRYKGPFPALRHLDLTTTGLLEGRIIIRDAPMLRKVRVNCIRYAEIDLPWEQLTTLSVSWFNDPAQVVTALGRSPALLDFTCGVLIAYTTTALPTSTHSLQSLTVANVGILRYLTLPRLERLSIEDISRNTASVAAELQSLISRSACDLKFLSVHPEAVTGLYFQLFLRAAGTSIVHLRLLFSDPAGFLHHIRVLQAPDILPRLSHLEITDNAGGDNYGPLLDVLRTRYADGSLESVELKVSSGGVAGTSIRFPASPVMLQFRALAVAGLKLRIHTSPDILTGLQTQTLLS
ncbi:hypothetical protein C8R43DRAFT_914639 [Mycena crocata]|nr:hypothetical protein C8R43DRAFT_914639 [Mycena crocata]